MRKLLLTLIILFCSVHFINGQNNKVDSLMPGRICKIVLYNGFQTEGKITERNNDTLTFQTDITNLYIPVKDIKFVLNPEVELSDYEDDLNNENVINSAEVIVLDSTEVCDIYMDDKTSLTDVKIIINSDNDTTLRVVKNNRSKLVSIAGIRKIEFRPTQPFGKGYFIGSIVGIGLGVATALAFSEYGFSLPGTLALCFLSSIPAGLIGGIIGSIAASNEKYLFDNGLTPLKLKRLRYVIEKHKDN